MGKDLVGENVLKKDKSRSLLVRYVFVVVVLAAELKLLYPGDP